MLVSTLIIRPQKAHGDVEVSPNPVIDKVIEQIYVKPTQTKIAIVVGESNVDKENREEIEYVNDHAEEIWLVIYGDTWAK